jgi:uncharacterized protein (TIGR00730 family)
MHLAVFTGSSFGKSRSYAEAAAELGDYLARQGIGVVYGGGHVGLMGVVADAAMAAGGEVIGVIPQGLADRELAHHGLTRLEIVETMHERKALMSDLSDGFVALPGGAGTLEEFFEVWTWQQLGIHAKPVCLYDVDGFWQPLRTAIDSMVDEGFLSAALRDALVLADEPESMLNAMRSWTSTTPKWTNRAESAPRP